MSFRHLSLLEREKLYAWMECGLSIREISRRLGRNHTSLIREITRNTKYGKKYIPCYAQARADRVGNRQRYKAPLKSPQVFLYVREKLRQYWSPETISGRIGMDIPGVSITPETIYRYIYSSKTRKAKLSKYLCRKHSKRRRQTGRYVHKTTKIPNAISIDNRARYIRKRVQLGHWESDLMEGPKVSGYVLSVSVERSTRYTILGRLTNKGSEVKSRHTVRSMSRLPNQIVRTLTLDNGSENTDHGYITDNISGIKVYYCHPYHSWEKGTVENTIGRIRRYIPKGTDLRLISDDKIEELEYILNSTPRKCLGYLTPYEKMRIELEKISV